MPLSSQIEEYKKLLEPIIELLREPNRVAAVQAAFAKRFTPLLREQERLPDAAFLLELLSREIEGSLGGLVSADQAYALEESDDPAVRQAVEDATTTLYDAVVQLRDEVVAVFGERGIAALGMSGDTARVPARLERHARTIVERLKDEKISLGTTKSTRLKLDRSEAATELQKHCDALVEQLKLLTKEKVELQQKQDERNRAIANAEEILPGNCAAARGLLLVAGDTEAAGRVISSPRRRATAEPEQSAPAEEPTAQ